MPSPVLIAPNRITMKENCNREVKPVGSLWYLSQKGDPHLPKKVPSPICVAGVRSPQMARAEVTVHLRAPFAHHLSAFASLCFGKQRIEKGVCSREMISVGHTGLIVVSVARASMGIPPRGFNEEPFPQGPVGFLSAYSPYESQQGGRSKDLNRAQSVSPPNLAPFITEAFNTRWIKRRFLGGWNISQDFLCLLQKPFPCFLPRSCGIASEARDIFRSEK